VRYDEHRFAVLDARQNFLLKIRIHPGRGVFQAFAARWRDVPAAAPLPHLLLAESPRRVFLVEPLQIAVIPFVQSRVGDDGHIRQPHPFQNFFGGFLRAREARGVNAVGAKPQFL
jgi:hypothetical protein